MEAGMIEVGIPVVGWPSSRKGGGYEVDTPDLLTEEGGFFLLEDGGKILLEKTEIVRTNKNK